MAVVSDELILIIYTEKWAATIPYLKVMCLIWAFQPIQICVIQAFKAIGKSDEYFKLEILKKLIAIILLIIAVMAFNTPLALAYALGIGQLVSTLMNAPRLKKFFNYNFKQQLGDVFTSLDLCLIMFILTYVIGKFCSNILIRLIVRVFLGVISYIILSAVTRNQQFVFFKNFIFGKENK